MTILKRKLVRELPHPLDRHSRTVVELTAAGITFREVGRRRGYLLPWDSAFWRAAEFAGEALRQERAQARRKRGGGR